MKTFQKNPFRKGVSIFLVLANIAIFGLDIGLAQNNVAEAKIVNLISNGSFESDFEDYFSVWAADDREYELVRTFQVPYGFGSHSAGITASGEASELFGAGLVSDVDNNKFSVTSGSNYSLTFYAKSTANTPVVAFIENALDYSAISETNRVEVGTSWQRYSMGFVSQNSGEALLAFAFGELADSQVLYIDGITLVEQKAQLKTKTIKGKAGDKRRFMEIIDFPPCDKYDVEIELPFYNPYTSIVEEKRFNPSELSSKGLYMDIYENTFSGIGKVYINSAFVGEFDYNVVASVDSFYPVLIRADQDITIVGSGFIPQDGHTFVVAKNINEEGGSYDSWIKPHSIDPELKQITIKMPLGVKSGSLYTYTSFVGINGEDVIRKSNVLNYKVKPAIFNVVWSKKGYEQVGDKLMIYGKGVSYKPTVNFYDEAGVKIDKKTAKVVSIGDEAEALEVIATTKTNKFSVTVVNNGIESDMAQAIEMMAMPKLASITGKYKRKMYASGEYIPAGKVGDTITLNGSALRPGSENPVVEFQGHGTSRIQVEVNQEEMGKDGKKLVVVIPEEAVDGYLNVTINGESSNSLPLEIIPSIESVSPEPIAPGQSMTILARGVKDNVALTEVYFKLDKTNTVTVKPDSISISPEGRAEIQLKAPMAVSNKNTEVSLRHNNWESNGEVKIGVNPVVTSASFDMDTKMLIIKGSGFSIHPKENKITYRYADEDRTVIQPAAKVQGIYPTQEGQEIRVKISDDYHYGFVSVQVGDELSNEANFGPVSVRRVVRRTEFVRSVGAERGVIYINGYNFGSEGGVMVGTVWADIHYRSDFFIIAVVDTQYLWSDPIIVAKE